MTIALSDNIPIFKGPRRFPIIERGIIDKQIEEWIEKGSIEPGSTEYACPVAVAKRKYDSP